VVGISRGSVAELDDCVQGRYSPWLSPYSDIELNKAQSSTAVTDALLEQISEHLFGLNELHLTGYQRVTHEGLVNALRPNKNGIRYLTMEIISPSLVRYHASPSLSNCI
jgi:hypothetical protein